MRILITNHSLDERGGVQTAVRTLARGLERLGHSVMAYGSDLNEGARLTQNDVIPVATDLEGLPCAPDIIHAQHHLDGMTALTALPGVPAVFHCHGATWRGTPFKHPRIYRYLTISRTMAARLSIESSIDPADIEVLLNSVELARFPSARALPTVPAKALVYHSRHTRDNATISSIRTAAERAGLTLDFTGFLFGTHTDAPEELLPNYDVVFASGLSALEALVCGCAVVVLGRSSCGSLVRPENFDQLRQVNLSLATNSAPSSADEIEQELRHYSAGQCAIVTERARQEADSAIYVQRLVSIYEEAIARHRAKPADPRGESVATSRYLRRLVPLIKMTDGVLGRHWSASDRPASFAELSARVALLEQQSKKHP
jgi:Glycosyltransferase Family 4